MGQPRSYALGVLLERLHNDIVLERLDTFATRGLTEQEHAKIKRRRDRKVKEETNRQERKRK